jgi:hypothetical protein
MKLTGKYTFHKHIFHPSLKVNMLQFIDVFKPDSSFRCLKRTNGKPNKWIPTLTSNVATVVMMNSGTSSNSNTCAVKRKLGILMFTFISQACLVPFEGSGTRGDKLDIVVNKFTSLSLFATRIILPCDLSNGFLWYQAHVR